MGQEPGTEARTHRLIPVTLTKHGEEGQLRRGGRLWLTVWEAPVRGQCLTLGLQ